MLPRSRAAADAPIDLTGTYPIVIGVNPDGSSYDGALELSAFRTLVTPEGRRIGRWSARYRYAQGGEVTGIATLFGDRVFLAYGTPRPRNSGVVAFRIGDDRLVGEWSTRNSGISGQELLEVPQALLVRLRGN